MGTLPRVAPMGDKRIDQRPDRASGGAEACSLEEHAAVVGVDKGAHDVFAVLVLPVLVQRGRQRLEDVENVWVLRRGSCRGS
jgi:hypothetical protein